MSRPPEGAQQQLQSRLRLPRMGGAQMPDTGIARNFATLDTVYVRPTESEPAKPCTDAKPAKDG